jgi:hypothetical protein
MSGRRLAKPARIPTRLTILPLRSEISVEALEQACPGDGVIYACDFYVTGAEDWTPEAGGLRSGRILNVDHHAPLVRMDAPLTSTRLAVEHVRTAGIAESGSWVVINHTDCDSVLSSGIMLGHLEPDDDFVVASICADHTGRPNAVADLLQALDEKRTGDRIAAQYAESMTNLRLLLQTGELLDPAAVAAVLVRKGKRSDAKALLRRFDMRDGLAFARCDREIDGAFLVQPLKDAVVIMLAVPDLHAPGYWVMKLRRGRGAPAGFSLHDLRVSDWDREYGGRANAGSNKRGGGTTMTPEFWAERLRSRLRALLDAPPE